MMLVGRRARLHGAMRVGQDGLLLDPLEIAPALLGRHRAAYFIKVLQHFGLAFGAQSGRLGKCSFNLGRHGVGLGQQPAQVLIDFVDLRATLGAPLEIGVMHMPNVRELGVGQMKLVLQPGQLRRVRPLHAAGSGGAGVIEGKISAQGQNNSEQENG